MSSVVVRRLAPLLALWVALAVVGEAAARAERARKARGPSRVRILHPNEIADLRQDWDRAPSAEAFMRTAGLAPHDVAALRAMGPGFEAKPRASARRKDPEARQRRARARAERDAVVDAVVELATRHRPPTIQALFEVVNASPEFRERYGEIPTDAHGHNWLLDEDHAHGDVLRRRLAREVGLTRRGDRLRRVAPLVAPPAAPIAALPARRPIRAIEGADRPANRPYALTYLARWSEVADRAGPRASFADVVARFARTPEAIADGRLPASPAAIDALAERAPPGVMIRWRDRRPTSGGRRPRIDRRLVHDLLDLPAMPPLLDEFLDRLDGEQPFAGHATLIVGHRYSDVVPFAEAMIRAGMRPSRARFVTTPYPFADATEVALEVQGVRVIEHARTVAGVKRGIEQAIRELLADGGSEPIQVIDDGGLASVVIRETFPELIGRFKITEVTTAGERLGDELAAHHGRMPIAYGSIARSREKRALTSGLHARRVVDKLVRQVRDAGLALPSRRAVVIGAGAMGLPAARALKQRAAELRAGGLDVVLLEKDAEAARRAVAIQALLGDPSGDVPIVHTAALGDALDGAGLLLGMTGTRLGGTALLARLADRAVIVQGSSKRNEFGMPDLERAAVTRRRLPRRDGLPQRSYRYVFDDEGAGGARSLNVLGDGWTLNHDGSLHGTPLDALQVELRQLIETAADVARTRTNRPGRVRAKGGAVDYFAALATVARAPMTPAHADADEPVVWVIRRDRASGADEAVALQTYLSPRNVSGRRPELRSFTMVRPSGRPTLTDRAVGRIIAGNGGKLVIVDD